MAGCTNNGVTPAGYAAGYLFIKPIGYSLCRSIEDFL